jgi:sensor histidine kinase regulating citrate/malate metabolism
MPMFHTVYVTKLGVPFIEEAQEYEDERSAASDAAQCFLPTRDENGNYHSVPSIVKTIGDRYVVLTNVDHIRVMTPEELNQAQEEERRAQEAAFNDIPHPD